MAALLGTGEIEMVAYLYNAPKSSGGKFTLTICAEPCSGAEFYNSEKIIVQNKREARAICAARSARPWNF